MGPARGRSLARSERSYPLRDGRTIGGRAIKAPVLLLRPSVFRRKWVCKTKEGMTDGRLLWKWRKSGEKRRGGGVRTEKEAEIGEGGSPKPMATSLSTCRTSSERAAPPPLCYDDAIVGSASHPPCPSAAASSSSLGKTLWKEGRLMERAILRFPALLFSPT